MTRDSQLGCARRSSARPAASSTLGAPRTLCEDHRSGGGQPDPLEEFPTGVAVGQIRTDPFDRTRRNRRAQLSVLAFHEARIVNLDPMPRRGKIHPVRPGVQPGSRSMTVSIPDEIAERRNPSIRTVRMATSHAPSGRVLAFGGPARPLGQRRTGSWNNASGRLDSIFTPPGGQRGVHWCARSSSSPTCDVYPGARRRARSLLSRLTPPRRRAAMVSATLFPARHPTSRRRQATASSNDDQATSSR